MLSPHFEGKRSRDPVDLLSTCHPSFSLTTFAFRSREVKRLLLDLGSYGCTDPLGMFPLFLKRTAEVLAPRLAVVFRRLLRLGSSPVCWRVANVTSIPKGPPSSSVSNYRPISLRRILSKVFERLVSVRLGHFMECRGVLPTTQFANRKGLGTCDVLLCVAHTLQSALEMGQEAKIAQIDFSATFDRVNQHGILFKLCSLGVGGSELFVLTQFLSDRSQYVVVDGCCSKRLTWCQRCLREVFGPAVVPLAHCRAFLYSGKQALHNADDSTLVAVAPSSGERVAISEYMNHDLNRVSVWCDLWGTKLNASKTKTMMVSRSRTAHP